MRRAAQAGLLLFAVVVSKSAFAAAPSFALSWTPSSKQPCMSGDELRAAVTARLGRDPFVLAEAQTTIAGREQEAASGIFHATIEERDPEGRVIGARDLEATTCAELRRSTIFVLVLIVDPEGARVAPKPVDREPPAPPRSTPASRTASPPIAIARRRSRADVGASLAISNGLLPHPDIGPVLTLGLAPFPAPIRLEWRGSYRLSLGDVRGVGFFAVEQQWRGCFVLRVRGSAVGATGCAGGTWAVIVPDIDDLARGDQRPQQVFGPLVAVGPTVELGRIRLAADLSASAPRPHYAFVFRDGGESATPLHEVGRLVWSLAIGATTSFW